MKFKLLVNAAHQGTGSTRKAIEYKKGDVIEDDQPLHKLFPNKFKKLGKADPGEEDVPTTTVTVKTNDGEEKTEDEESSPQTEEEKESGEENESADDASDKSDKSLGRDVTRKFPAAAKADLKVYNKDGLYNVAESDEPKTALNEEPLRRKDLDKFIKNHTK